jgi:hypothetical protein
MLAFFGYKENTDIDLLIMTSHNSTIKGIISLF